MRMHFVLCILSCIVNFYPVADKRIESISGKLGVHTGAWCLLVGCWLLALM
jgi:hypothetical protein